MASTKDPVLTVWEAMNLLTEVDKLSDIPEISEIIADTEMILLHLTNELVQRSGNRNPPGCGPFSHPLTGCPTIES
jgi:hypothetical protein